MIPPIASRSIAGEGPAEAIDHARRLNERSIGALLNLLGEHYEAQECATADAEAYCWLLEDPSGTDVRACVSVKPSQLGLDIEDDLLREQLWRIVETAAPEGFVWIDMEDHTTVDATLDAYETAARETPWTAGVCLQANLRRTREDLRRLVDVPGKVRLVKGAHDLPRSIAYRDQDRVNEAHESLLDLAFREFDRGVAVATHDPRMIERATALGAEHGTGFQIQMLTGVREAAQSDLARDHELHQYVPYGTAWLSYFYRRVTERRENLRFALRALRSVVFR